MNSIQIAQTSTEQISSVATPERILSKEQYLLMKETWASTKEHSAAQIIIYNVLRGFTPSRGFTPLTARKVTSRSNDKWDGFNKARYAAELATLATIPMYLRDAKLKAYLEATTGKFKATFGIDPDAAIQAATKAIEGL